MDQTIRSELDKIHERISNMKERVVLLEAQQPHINAALLRIEGSVEKIAAKIGKAIWLVLAPIIAVTVGVMLKALFSGALSTYL